MIYIVTSNLEDISLDNFILTIFRTYYPILTSELDHLIDVWAPNTEEHVKSPIIYFVGMTILELLEITMLTKASTFRKFVLNTMLICLSDK